MVDYFINKINSLSLKNNFKNIGIVGLAYRSGVNSLAYARSIPLVKKIITMGYNVFVFDSILDNALVQKEFGFNLNNLTDLNKCDIILIVNGLKDYKEELLKIKHNKIIIDPQNFLGE
jgi:UDP-N-acetyl-D-mannosaminuronate dehydrogenase